MSISNKAQRLVDRYVARVKQALAHHDPAQRQEILDGLRAHIRNELAARGASNPPSIDEVRAVLSGMDAPHTFSQDDEVEASIRIGRSRQLGRLGLAFFLGALVLFVLSLVLGAWVSDGFFRAGLMISGMLVFASLGLGVAGWRDPLGKAAIICSVLALAAALVMIPTQQATSARQAPAVVRVDPSDPGSP